LLNIILICKLLRKKKSVGGIIENMHLNWKWRELVKIIVKKSYFMYWDKDEVKKIARMLETESGGVLVGICPILVGVAIIVYHGKDYQHPIEYLVTYTFLYTWFYIHDFTYTVLHTQFYIHDFTYTVLHTRFYIHDFTYTIFTYMILHT
jgi:hypothetical protein